MPRDTRIEFAYVSMNLLKILNFIVIGVFKYSRGVSFFLAVCLCEKRLPIWCLASLERRVSVSKADS